MPIIINNMRFNGSNIEISGNRIKINGKDVTGDLPDVKEYNIKVEGNCDKIICDEANKIEIDGSVNELKTMSGNVSCGDVKGNVKTMSGNVSCQKVDGNIKSMSGNISTF